jgi:pimeloyl-ACP methyl ester carboxylesterase
LRFVTSDDGTRIALYEYGSPDAPVLLCVHGYPDSARMWEPVATELAGRFRVVAYDVRGAGESDHPAGRAAYGLDRLEQDFAAVLDAVSPGAPVHLLAHDWGSIQSWHFVTGERVPGRIASYVSISGPCLDHVALHARAAPRRQALRQVLHSWYVFAFQLPWLPEYGWRRGWWTGLFRRLQAAGDPSGPASGPASGAPGGQAVADKVSGVQLYRANVLRRLLRPESRHTGVPVLVVAPASDPFVLPSVQAAASRWASDLRVEVVDGGHWLPRSEPSLVARLALEHVEEVVAR